MDTLNEAYQKGLVVGLRDIAGIAPRLDIDELLLKHPETFNLLIIALKELKGETVPWDVPNEFKIAKENKFSFFQIAGIHGLPLTEWDHEHAPGKTPNGGNPGYCAHGTPTFGPWHRPYLSMLEQTLFRHIANIAQRFSQSSKLSQAEKKAYMDAAKQFRLPYWDYYRPRGYQTTFPGVSKGKTTTAPFDYRLPQIFTLPEVMVKTLPDNELKAVANPFWQYKFAAGDLKPNEWQLSGIDLTVAAVRDHTLRYGGNDDASVSAMNSNLNKIREDEMRASLSMIEAGAYSNFLAISTTGVIIKGTDPDTNKILQDNTGSLEGLHNNYHVYVGGFSGNDSNTGHMSCVPVAAFDPVFWIHHCQIDRLFAIWQTVNPTHWFNELPSSQRALADDTLLPFRKYPLSTDNKSRYWTSNEARDTEVFGYTYPDIADKKTKSADQLRADFAAKYGWSRRLTPFQHFGTPPADMQPLDLGKAQVYQYTSGVPSASLFRPLFTATVGVKDDLPKTQQQLQQQSLANVASASGHTDQPPLAVGKEKLEPPQKKVLLAQAQAQANNNTPVSTRVQATAATTLPTPPPKVSHEWFIDSVVERLALNGSFTIFYIVGDVDGTSGADWSTLPGFAGVTHVFASPTEVCDNCGKQEHQAHLVTSTSPVTSLLIDYVERGQLASMEAQDVERFLVKNLKWRVQTAKGEVINPRHLFHEHSLRLSISCKTAPLPGETGEVQYSFYPQVIATIIAQSS